MNARPPFATVRRIARPLRAAAFGAVVGLCAAASVQAATPAPIPVTIANTPVAVSNTAGEQPFEMAFSNINVQGSFWSSAGDLYTVPAGKRLLIRSATFLDATAGATSARTFTVLLIRRGGAGDSYATIQTAPNTGALAAATQPLHLGLRAGERLQATVSSSGSSGFSALISVSGVLIDAP